MAQTERITFLVTKDFKKWLTAEAKKSGLSISELIRLRCESGSSEDIITIKASVNELKIATARANRALDEGLKEAYKVINQLRKGREIRKKGLK
ncbi:MAG: hypothetical protein CVU51_00335 [Deltaproteobacteria bacterium HGW-Deltaproteobacteria-1]|jgi:hypothetical protein|nr:MAG: hypothetical protein CVU51_00335 [Deltaproteobacteria bacterium HGW-Deltaproteobacteria-1]